MWLSRLVCLTFFVAFHFSTSITAFVPTSTAGTDALAKVAKHNLNIRNSTSQQCDRKELGFRKEWTDLCPPEKKEWIDAVLCMERLPSISGDLAPGAKNRYDDFVATHINQTLTIHGTGNFLMWHRYFTWTWEKALGEECGYRGYQPYINWGRYALDLINAPIFDGSKLSIGGNGAYMNHSAANIPSDETPYIIIPPGSGGGCVQTGPFANSSVNLGSVSPVLKNLTANPRPDGLGYNPRCLRRDMSQCAAQNWVQDQNITDLITQSLNISTFQTTLQGNFPAGFLGVHTGGHFFVGGDPDGDLFTSPGDPWWYLHHSQIDRIWWIWQNQDPANRVHTIGDTITINNSPPSRNEKNEFWLQGIETAKVACRMRRADTAFLCLIQILVLLNATLEDVIDLGVNAPASIELSELVDTRAGPFCYSYE